MKYAIWMLCAEELYYDRHECPSPGLYSTSLFVSEQIALVNGSINHPAFGLQRANCHVYTESYSLHMTKLVAGSQGESFTMNPGMFLLPANRTALR